MARTTKLKPHVLQTVATHAAHSLAGLARASGDASLHESLPIWLMTGGDLERLRAEREQGRDDLRECMRKTALWLHLLYRNGEPFGYVHGHHRPKGKHQVTNVSVTREALLIRQAIDEVDRVSNDEDARAAIFECPKVGLAGILLFPRRRKEPVRICLFRDPAAPADWSPTATISEAALTERLLGLHVIKGPHS
jgi:hypothetical protein